MTLDIAETLNGFLHISVSDTGIGIREKNWPDVFEMFKQASDGAHRSYQSNGLGLAVTKLLVGKLAGQIGFQSEEGKGSTFWVELPLSSNEIVIIWSENLSVGIDELDKGNQIIVSLTNMIAQRAVSDDDLEEIVSELCGYVQHQLKLEEIVMKSCGVPDIDDREGRHLAFTSQFGQLSHQDQTPEALDQSKALLKQWVVDHIESINADLTPNIMGRSSEIQKALNSFHLDA